MEPKRKLLKGKLSAKEATTFSKICSLETDHCDTRNAWMSLSEKSVYICVQKNGHAATEHVTLSRKDFEKFYTWYITKQKTYR